MNPGSKLGLSFLFHRHLRSSLIPWEGWTHSRDKREGFISVYSSLIAIWGQLCIFFVPSWERLFSWIYFLYYLIPLVLFLWRRRGCPWWCCECRRLRIWKSEDHRKTLKGESQIKTTVQRLKHLGKLVTEWVTFWRYRLGAPGLCSWDWYIL